MGCVLKLIMLTCLLAVVVEAEDYPRSTRTIARLFGFGESQPAPQQPQPVVPHHPPVQPFPPGQVQQVVRKPLVYSVKYYDRTGDVNGDVQGPQQYDGVQPTQRVFLNLYTGQTSPVYYDNKGQLLVPCPVYDHVYMQQHANVVQVPSQGVGVGVSGGGPDPKQKSYQQHQQEQRQQQQQQQPVGVVKPGPVPVPVTYNINNVGSQVPQHQQQQRQQQETQQQVVSVVPPPPQPVPVPVVQHSMNGPTNFVPIPIPSQVVYDRYHQHQQMVNSHSQQIQSPFHVTSSPDVIYYAVPTSTSGIPVAIQAPPPQHHHQQQVQVQHQQNGGQVQVPVQYGYGPPPGMYTGLPYDVPYQYVVASPPGSYYPYVYVKQATPTVSVQHSTQSQSSVSQTQVPGQVQQVKSDQQQHQQDKKEVADKGVESH